VLVLTVPVLTVPVLTVPVLTVPVLGVLMVLGAKRSRVVSNVCCLPAPLPTAVVLHL
jgi:hypothetical protein